MSSQRRFPPNPPERTDGYPVDWPKRRKAVRKRDSHQCQHCGSDDTELHVHHIIPKSRGGHHGLNNLVTLCWRCHDEAHPTHKITPSSQSKPTLTANTTDTPSTSISSTNDTDLDPGVDVDARDAVIGFAGSVGPWIVLGATYIATGSHGLALLGAAVTFTSAFIITIRDAEKAMQRNQ